MPPGSFICISIYFVPRGQVWQGKGKPHVPSESGLLRLLRILGHLSREGLRLGLPGAAC